MWNLKDRYRLYHYRNAHQYIVRYICDDCNRAQCDLLMTNERSSVYALIPVHGRWWHLVITALFIGLTGFSVMIMDFRHISHHLHSAAIMHGISHSHKTTDVDLDNRRLPNRSILREQKIESRCRRTLRGEGHCVAGWDTGGSVEMLLQNADPKSVRSGNIRPLSAPRRLLLMLVSTLLWIVNRCCSGQFNIRYTVAQCS